MAAESLAPGESEADIDVCGVIDGFYDLRALAAAGYAMSDDTPDEDVHNMGRIFRKIYGMAGVLAAQLDGLDLSQARKGGAV